ncbi:unnamed protein product [Microthlaspi erraticum]|uniref:DUF4283 domain-containing protein n=1 Tax=Microthlaspi erraticum TaxID=1685480 RepID=A0A6D2JDV7_9BRAS|nr:unnamed protein product [Microthlaspi erraticum]
MTKKKKKPPFASHLVPRYAPRSMVASASGKLLERCLFRARSAHSARKSSASCPPVSQSSLPGLSQVIPPIPSPAQSLPGSGSRSQELCLSPTSQSSPSPATVASPAPSATGSGSSPSRAPPVPNKPISPTAPPSTGKKWSSLFPATAALKSYGPPETHISGVPFILIPDENVGKAKEEFKDFIYASFPGHPPEMGRIIGVINAIWARTGPRIYVHRIGPGCFLIKVSNPRTRAILLSRNLWNITGHPMCVAPWSPDFTPEQPPLTKAQVMVEFRGIPYLLFNDDSLARIASGVGEPKALSPETARKDTFEVAKIVVEVDLFRELPTTLVSGLSSGKEFVVSVTYPWLPPRCGDCSAFGHTYSHCPKRPPPTRERRKPQSRSRSRSRSRNKSSAGAKEGRRSRPGRSMATRWEKKSTEPTPETVMNDEGVQVSDESDPKPKPGLSEEEGMFKHDPPTGVSMALAEVFRENPFFLVERKKSGRKVTQNP